MDRPTLVAVGMLAALVTLAAHEVGHLVAANVIGAELGSAEVDDGGAIVLSVAGPLSSLIAAALGFLLARMGFGRPDWRTVAGWFLLSFSLWTVVGAALASALLETGDWMPIVNRFPNRLAQRVTIGITGLFSAGLAWRATIYVLARVAGNGRARDRRDRARAAARMTWLGGALVAVVVAGAGFPAQAALFVTTIPVLFASRTVEETPVPGEPLTVDRSWLVIASAAVGIGLLVFSVRSGVRFAG